MEALITWGIAVLLLAGFMSRYWIAHRKREAEAHGAAERAGLVSHELIGQHPLVHTDACIGCGACIDACPEGDVLGLINGKATIIKGNKCIGHGLCADACPVGAITIVTAPPGASAELPLLTQEHETSIPNLFIAGELGGLALIRNAVNQGRRCIDEIAARIDTLRASHSADVSAFDVIIVGAGPAGITASLRAAELGLSALTLERETVGGTVSKYPRQKLVMTSPVELPLYGKLRQTKLSKEELLRIWETILQRTDLNIRTGEGVEAVRMEDGVFYITTSARTYASRAVVLALGRAGTPRKLGVPGEELPHVLYRLIDADHYTQKNILIVGGGDSAVEASLGLAHQPGNSVTLSYRRSAFSRLKQRNEKRILEQMRNGRVNVVFDSQPVEFRHGSVLLECSGEIRELANDYVWIFAGGTLPTVFLKSVGVGFGSATVQHDTVEVREEAAPL
jgi:thioredoxin reductase/NAD-dependent dihydropyrimidine dehydrogenase PreA subunit